MIKFKTIKWKNFLSTGNTFTEINLNSTDTTLIIGKNGAGKSTVLDALSFVLFNKPFRNINKPQLVNSINNKDCLVEVEFDIKNVSYKVVRGIKPAIFEVYMDGTLINQEVDSLDYQDKFEKTILKSNHNTFCKTEIVGAASYIPFMQLKTPQRREFIDDILNLKIVTTMNVLLKSKVQNNTTAINDNETQKKLINEKIKLITEHIKELESSSEKQTEEKAEKIKLTETRIKELETEIDTIKTSLSPLKEEVKDHQKFLTKKNKMTEVGAKLKASKEALEETIEFLNHNDSCPTCSQHIDTKFKCETVSSKEQKIKDINDGLEKLRKEYVEVNEKLKYIEATLNYIREGESEISKNNALIASNKKYIKELQIEIKKSSTEDIDNNKKKIKELNKELLKCDKTHEELLQEKQLLTIAQSMLKDNGIKATIVKQYIPIINKLINKYLAAMDFFVSFELDENFNEVIKSRFRDDFKYDSFSEGEKFRIDLALLFTWRAIAKMRNSLNTNILFMDEVMDSSLDSNGTEEFLKIIKQLTKDTNVYIISHKTDQILDKFSKVIKFEKIKNFSKIVNI